MKSTILLVAAALGAAAFTPPRLFGPPRTRAQALAYARKAVFKGPEDKDNADTGTPVPPPKGSQRAPSSKMMVDSWYDKGTRLSKDAPTAAVESWYDSGVRLTVEDEEQAPLPAGMSAAAAARSPQLAVAALKSEAEIAEIMARLDTFPTKAGTMYGALVRLRLRLRLGLFGHHVWCAAHSELPPLLPTLSDVLSEPQPQPNPNPNPDPQFQPAPTRPRSRRRPDE